MTEDRSAHCDTVVVGGGVIDCSSAYWLARAGHSVTVLERR
ncbi:MAG: FAD-dependent oxidoreductase, partial [Acidimicrobiales bacterium]